MTIRSELEALSGVLTYSHFRQFLVEAMKIEKPGKGLNDLFDTIVNHDQAKHIVKQLKKLPKYVALEKKKASKGKAKLDKSDMDVLAQIADSDEDDDDDDDDDEDDEKDKKKDKEEEDVDDDDSSDDDDDEKEEEDAVMQKLKCELQLRKLTALGTSYPILVQRLLKSIEKCDDMQDAMLDAIDSACKHATMTRCKKIKLISKIVSDFRSKS